MIDLEAQVAGIEAMSSKQRKAEWHRRMGTVAPPAFGAGLLARVLAHELQAKTLGALSKADLKRLANFGLSGQLDPSTGVVKPGTWLSRTWHGEVYQVVVLETAFEYRGERFSSLSKIARRITGTHWSGPRFFGLRSPRLGRLGVSADGR